MLFSFIHCFNKLFHFLYGFCIRKLFRLSSIKFMRMAEIICFSLESYFMLVLGGFREWIELILIFLIV